MRPRSARTLLLVVLAAVALAAAPAAAAQAAPVTPPEVDPPVGVPGAAGTSAPDTRAQADGEPLVGTFRLTAGECSDDGADGSYFRMTQPAGQPIENGDSPCDNQSYTPLSPGTDGGLVTGAYQPHPDPAFDDDGNGVNDSLTQPAAFFGVDFSTATNPTDPQTDTEVNAPEITVGADGSLSGDLRSFAAAWNEQHFNQGSPKPDGERPEGTNGPDGTYDDATGAFVLEWSSRISGGPFNGFTGTWHFEGTFESNQQESRPQPGGGGDTSDGGESRFGAAGGQASQPATPDAAASTQAGQAGTSDAHPRTGPPAGAAFAGSLLAAAFAASRLLRRRAELTR